MAYPASWSERDETVLTVANETGDGLELWRDEHPGATVGESAFGVRQRRTATGKGLSFWVNGQGAGYPAEGVECSVCGGWMEFKGYLPWTVYGLEGDVRMERAYYVCPRCKVERLSPSWI